MQHAQATRLFRRSTLAVRYVQGAAHISLLALLSLLPLPLAYRLARGLGRLKCVLDVRRRDLCMDALVARLGIDRDEARRMARRAFELQSCENLENWLVPRVREDSIGRLIRFEGLEHLDAALARGKGVVLYSGHIWGTRLCIVGLGLLGYRMVTVRRRRDFDDQPVHRWLFDRYRRAVESGLGGRILAAVGRDGSMAIGALCVNALRRNEIVALKPDRLFKKTLRPGDIDVPFLNGMARFRPGGVLLARATGAALLSLWIHRPDDFLPGRCVIGPPILDDGGDVRLVVEAQAAQMEAHVRLDPACLRPWLARWPTRRRYSRSRASAI